MTLKGRTTNSTRLLRLAVQNDRASNVNGYSFCYNYQKRGMKMARVKDLTLDDLEYLIEQKILEPLEDPDSGLEIREDFKEELKRRLESPSSERVSQAEVVQRNIQTGSTRIVYDII